MKSLSKKLLVALLSVGMVVTMIPFTAFPAEAATNLDGGLEGQDSDVFSALGFDTSELPEGYDPDTTDNPYGRDKVPGNQVFELSVAGASGSTDYGKNDNTVNPASISGMPGGTGTGMEMAASAAGDFDGDGLAGELVYVGYSSEIDGGDQAENLEFEVTPADVSLRIYNGRTGSYGSMKKIGAVHPFYTAIDYSIGVSAAYEYQWLNLLKVTAGDYDGDGISEIAVYVAENGSPRVDIYKYQKKSDSQPGDWIDINNWGRVWSHPLSGEYVPNMVSLVSGDFNQDGIDDLGISHGRAIAFKYNSYTNYDAEASQAVILWGDRSNMLQNSSPLNLNQEEFGQQVRVSLITGDLDQDGTPELIATGQPLSNFNKRSETFLVGGKQKTVYYGNAERTAITYTYDETQGMLINSSELFEPLKGTFQSTEVDGTIYTSWTVENGYDENYWSMPGMCTNAAVFKPAGADYAYLYLDSCLYECVEGKISLKGELDEKYDGEHSFALADKKKWGARSNGEQAAYAEYGAIAADINGNGEQILTVNSVSYSSTVKSSLTNSEGEFYDQYAVVSGNSDGTMTATITCPEEDTTEDYQGVALAFMDNDTDTVIMEYTGQHYLTYSDPKILAIIAAAPYFEDVDEATGYEFAGNNTNAWGMTHGHSDATTFSIDFSVGGWGNHELKGGGGNFGIEWAANFTLSYEKSWTDSYEYTMTFGTYGDQDAIAFYSVPTENYIYRIKTPDGKGGYTEELKPVTKAYQPAYQVLTLDYYETIRKDYPAVLPAVKGKAITSTPGDPASYPSSYDEFDKKDIIVKWDQDAAGVGYGNGSITQEISVTTEEESAYSLGAEIEFQIGGGAEVQLDAGQVGFENTWGGAFSINPAGGWATTTMKGTTIEAEVANMPVEFQQYGYYFNWKLFSYYYKFGDITKEKKLSFNTENEDEGDFSVYDDVTIGAATSARVPVITFAVSDVAKPPLLPDDFQQDYDRSTSESNVMTWTYDDPVSAFIIHKQFDFPVGGGLQEVARIQPGDSRHYQIKYDEEGNPYKEYFFVDTNLSPYTEYQYAIQVERLDPVPPLSTPSALVTARTKAEDGYPKINIAESDEEQDGKLLVYPDKNAYLTAGVTGPEGETIANYYSVVQYQWQKKEKGAWNDLIGETNKTLTFASAGVDTEGEYRCRVNVITKANNVAITAYSGTVELTHAKRTSYMKKVSVTDVAGGGIQLYAEVGNAHKDSASIPGGTVTFTLTSNNSDQTYQYTAPLTAAGTMTAVIDEDLPEGLYSVEAYYSGSYIFKSCKGTSIYLSQRATGYVIDMPNTATYGDETEIIFREASKSGGITSTEDVNAGVITMYKAAPLSRAALSGAVEYVVDPEVTEPVTVNPGEKYYYVDGDGIKWYFTAPMNVDADSNVPDFDLENGYAKFGDNLSADRITKVTGIGTKGQYLLKADTTVGVYLISMKKDADMDEMYAAYTSVEVLPREVTLQIPTNLKTGESETLPADPITFKNLSLVNGSWADCDFTEDVFNYADDSIIPKYYNTAGKEFDETTVRAFCGAYTIIGTKTLPNYRITWRSGQLTVLGAANAVDVGVRPFDGLNVGKVYMMSPEVGVATGPLNDSSGVMNKRIQAGVRMIFSAQPDEGYEIYDWYINGKAQNNKNSTLVYTMLAEDTTVEVQFAIKQNTFTFGIAGDENGGVLTCSDNSLSSGSVIRRNAAFTFTAKANPGYHFKEWRYTEQGLGTAYNDEDGGGQTSTFDFVMPNISCSLYAVFERDGYVFNYIDGNNAKGLTATYENEEGKTVTARAGSTITGGTEITVTPAAGYVLDKDRNYISQGTQGTADYDKETYTLTLDQDTTVYGWTKQLTYDLELAYAIAPTSKMIPDATINYIIDDRDYSFSYEEFRKNGAKTIQNIPGGSAVTVEIDAPGWVDLKGWTANDTYITATTEDDPLATAIQRGGRVEKDKSYSYMNESDGYTYFFTSPVNGTADWSGSAVTVYSSSVRYTIPAIHENEKLTVFLKEKPVHVVTMADISENGIYSLTLPEGGFYGTDEDPYDETLVNVHDGDDFVVMVRPFQGKTVAYWTTTPESGEAVTRPATSLRYTIPNIVENYTFEPIFSTTTYNMVTWPTISEKQNGLNLDPESSYIASVASGEGFKFKLSGKSLNLVDKVCANGHQFTADGNEVDGTTYKVDNGVYSITNVTENQEITVTLKTIGVTVNGVDIVEMAGTGWTYDSGTQVLTLTRSGLVLSGRNDQVLAPDLSIVTTETAGALTLDDLNVTSAAIDPMMGIAAETVVTIAGNNNLTGTEATVLKADNNLTVRGNGSLNIVSEVNDEKGYAFYAGGDLTFTGTVDAKIHATIGSGLYVEGTMTVGVKNSKKASPTLRLVSDNEYGSVNHNVDLFGGEIIAYGKVAGMALPQILSAEVSSISCYDGILEVSSDSNDVFGGNLSNDALKAYYENGYMIRSRAVNGEGTEEPYVSGSKLASEYNMPNATPPYDKVTYYDSGDSGSCSCDKKLFNYMRLSPLTGKADEQDFILSVEYKGNTYKRSVKDYWGPCLYYIDADDDEVASDGTLKLRILPWYGSNVAYDCYYTLDSDGKINYDGPLVFEGFTDDPDTGYVHDFDPNKDIVVAENFGNSNEARDLYFNVLEFYEGDQIEAPVIDDEGQQEMQLVGYYYNLRQPTADTPLKLDYTLSGAMSGQISTGSYGAIYADGQLSDEGYFPEGTTKTNNIRTLTLDNLTHIRMLVDSALPVYLKGNNYLIGTITGDVPLTVNGTEDKTLDLRGTGTLTVSVQGAEALNAKNIKLTDVAALTLISDTKAISDLNDVKYYNGEGDDALNIPYGLGWQMDEGSKASDAVTRGELDPPGTTSKYVKFYVTSTDANSNPEQMLYDKSSPDGDPTDAGVRLTPPTVMGVPHLFTPGKDGSKVEFISGSTKTVLKADEDYTYTAFESEPLKGTLKMLYGSSGILKNLPVGEYTIRVSFYDEKPEDATYYTLDIPLIVQDTAHVINGLTPIPESLILTRGNSANIKTKFEGTTPKTYQWELASLETDGKEEGIVLPDTTGAANSVEISDNAAHGKYKITVTSYEDSAKTQKLGEAMVDLTVAPKAIAISVSCATETPSGDESYMLYHNTLDNSIRSWDFDASVTMDDGKAADREKISWKLWGAEMRQTEVDENGVLRIDPNETGLLDSGYLLLTAIYINEDGTKLEKTVKIRLSEDAMVGYTPGTTETGGTISAAKVTNPKGTPIPKNTEVTFSAAPATDYEVDTWYINGQPAEEGVDGNTMTFTTEKMGRYNVWATFTRKKNCTVTFSAEGKEGSGTIMAETENGVLASGDSVAKGTKVTFTAIPEPLCSIDQWTMNGTVQSGTEETFVIDSVSDSIDVKVRFAVPDRKAAITVGSGGTISFLVNGKPETVTADADGKYTFKADDIVTVLAVPDEGYIVDKWTDLKNAEASDAICTIPRGKEEAEATISFAEVPTHKVTVSNNSYENGGGTVSYSTETIPMSEQRSITVADGNSLTLTAAPDEYSFLYDWTVEPGTYKDYEENGETLTLTNITEDITVSATFQRNTHTVALNNPTDGSLEADYQLIINGARVNEQSGTIQAGKTATIRSGSEVIVKVTPDNEKYVSSFAVNGEDRLSNLTWDKDNGYYTYRIDGLAEDVVIEAVFGNLDLYTVTAPPAEYQETVEEASVPTGETSFSFEENGINHDPNTTDRDVRIGKGGGISFKFIPKEGYTVDTDKLSQSAREILTGSEAAFSFKQSADGMILLVENIDKDLDFSGLPSPFVTDETPAEEYVNLTVEAGQHGTLAVVAVVNETENIQYMNGTTKVKRGTVVSYKAVPDEHYAASVKVDGETADTIEGQWQIDADTTISAEFEPSEYKVNVTIVGKGSGKVKIGEDICDSDEYWIKPGSVTIQAVPDEGSAVDGFVVDNEAVQNPASITLNKDISVVVSFSDTMRTVTYESEGSGELNVIDASGQEVPNRTSIEIGTKLYAVATPDPHYDTTILTVGGTDLANNNYFLVDEDRGNNVYGKFIRAEVKVSWEPHPNGRIEAKLMPEGTAISNGQYVPTGSLIKFIGTPNSNNYTVRNILVSGAKMNASGYYVAEQEDIMANAVIEYTGDAPGIDSGLRVTWIPVNCEITAVLANGTALKNGDYVNPGDKIRFTHRPTKSDYTFDKFTVVGAEQGSDGYYVAGSSDIVASAVYNAPTTTVINDPDVPLDLDGTYTVLIDSGEGGHVDVTIKGDAVKSGDEVDLGSKLTIKAVPDEGQQVKSLTVNGVKFQNGEEYVVYANTLIKAEFEEATSETGLPCYKDDRGSTVYSGFSYDLNGDGVYTEDEYIIPKDVEVHFQENHKYFEDMPGNWADEYIQFVGDREIFQGVTDTLFDPEGKVTRAMYVTVIGRLYERSFGAINGGTAQNFTDCDYDSWYGKYVDWAAATGVVNGYDATTFGPNDNVTREQMAAILTRFAKLMKLDTKANGSLSFTDMDTISDYAVDSVQYCVDKGIINGYDDGRFAPQDNATRAQIAAVIVRYIESVLSK